MSKSDSNQSQLRGYRFVFLLIGIILALAVAPSMNFVKADNINPSLYSTNEAPHGISYQKWIERFWQWKYSLPTAENPLRNYSSQKCTMGQQGPVWFLAELLSGKEERTCTISAGKSILLPLLDGECDLSDTTLHNDQDVRQCASEGNDNGVISASIDGVPLNNLNSYRTHSEFFNLTIPADNVFKEGPPGTYKAFAEGFFLFLKPLAPGKHDVHYTFNVVNPIKTQYNYAADLTYHLVVSP